MMIVELTEQSPGVYALPMIGGPTDKAAKIKLFKNVRYPPNYPMSELNKVGLFEYQVVGYDEVNLRSTATTPSFDGSVVKVTHTTQFADLAKIQERRIGDVRRHAVNVANGGFIINVGGNDRYFATQPDDMARRNTIASALSLGETYPPAGIPVFTMDGNKIKVTEAQFTAFMKAQAQHLIAVANREDVLVDAIEAETDEQTIINLDISTGWPANPVI